MSRRRYIVKVPGRVPILIWFSFFVIMCVVGWSSWYKTYGDNIEGIVLPLVLAALALLYFCYLSMKRLRIRAIRRYLNLYRYAGVVTKNASIVQKIGPICLDELLDKKRAENVTSLFITGGLDWSYGDFSFDKMHETKNGEYVASTYYLSIYMLRLPRELPLMLFDSHNAWRRQYKAVYDKRHRYSFEGNLNKYFDSYIPHYYQIDILSIITPEVMESLIAASEYDIEISSNNLYLIAPMRADPEQEQDMKLLASRIRQKLMNNMLTYRDERISYERGRKDIGAFGLVMYKNLTSDWLFTVCGLVCSLMLFRYLYTNDINDYRFLLYFLIPTGMSIYRIVKEKRRRRTDKILYRNVENDLKSSARMK